MGEHIYHERIALKYKILSLRCGAHRRDSLHRGDCLCRDHFVIEYLGENETEIENTLGYLSGAQMGSNHEKNRG